MKTIYWSILVLCCIFFMQPLYPDPLVGRISEKWSLDSLRKEALASATKYKDVKQFEAIDPNLLENRQLINNKIYKTEDREIALYESGMYTIRYYNDPELFNVRFFYTPSGQLEQIAYTFFTKENLSLEEFNKLRINLFPRKIYFYDYPDGELTSVGINVSWNEGYVFNLDGSFNNHWLNNKGYRANGEVCYKAIHIISPDF